MNPDEEPSSRSREVVLVALTALCIALVAAVSFGFVAPLIPQVASLLGGGPRMTALAAWTLLFVPRTAPLAVLFLLALGTEGKVGSTCAVLLAGTFAVSLRFGDTEVQRVLSPGALERYELSAVLTAVLIAVSLGIWAFVDSRRLEPSTAIFVAEDEAERAAHESQRRP